MAAKILAFAGSTRKDSFNKKLISYAASTAEPTRSEITVLDLQDYPLPLFQQDLEAEEGPPQNATKLYELFLSHDALLLSSPEYNGSISPLMKNTLDWVSRPREGEPPLAAFSGKVVGLLSASPGGFGGMRGLSHLRDILMNVGTIVLPQQVAVGTAHEAFGDDGALVDERLSKLVTSLVASLATTASQLKGTPTDE